MTVNTSPTPALKPTAFHFHNYLITVQWRSQPKIFDLGEQQYFCLGRLFAKHEMTSYSPLKIGGMAPWTPRLRLCLLYFSEADLLRVRRVTKMGHFVVIF